MEYLQKRQFSRRYYLENVASAVGGCANLGQTEVGDRKTYDIRDKTEEADDIFLEWKRGSEKLKALLPGVWSNIVEI